MYKVLTGVSSAFPTYAVRYLTKQENEQFSQTIIHRPLREGSRRPCWIHNTFGVLVFYHIQFLRQGSNSLVVIVTAVTITCIKLCNRCVLVLRVGGLIVTLNHSILGRVSMIPFHRTISLTLMEISSCVLLGVGHMCRPPGVARMHLRAVWVHVAICVCKLKAICSLV